MMRPHCDRCDALCDVYQKLVEDVTLPIGSVDFRMATYWHIEIDAGGAVQERFQKVFCRACWIAILEMHVATLKAEKQHA